MVTLNRKGLHLQNPKQKYQQGCYGSKQNSVFVHGKRHETNNSKSTNVENITFINKSSKTIAQDFLLSGNQMETVTSSSYFRDWGKVR